MRQGVIEFDDKQHHWNHAEQWEISSHFLRCCHACVGNLLLSKQKQRWFWISYSCCIIKPTEHQQKRENNNFPTTTNSWSTRNDVKQIQFVVVDEKWFCVFMQLSWKRFKNLKEPLRSMTVAFQWYTEYLKVNKLDGKTNKFGELIIIITDWMFAYVLCEIRRNKLKKILQYAPKFDENFFNSSKFKRLTACYHLSYKHI